MKNKRNDAMGTSRSRLTINTLYYYVSLAKFQLCAIFCEMLDRQRLILYCSTMELGRNYRKMYKENFCICE